MQNLTGALNSQGLGVILHHPKEKLLHWFKLFLFFSHLCYSYVGHTFGIKMK